MIVRSCHQHSVAIDGRLQIQWQKYELGLLIQLRNLGVTPPTIHSPVRSRGKSSLFRLKLPRPIGIHQNLEVGIIQVFCILNGNLCALHFDSLFRLSKFLSVSVFVFELGQSIIYKQEKNVQKGLMSMPSIFMDALFEKYFNFKLLCTHFFFQQYSTEVEGGL